jgi:hypothetical protein
VGELNELTITGQISLPFDRGCRIAVSGPSDMPLISSDLKQVSLNGAEILIGKNILFGWTNSNLPASSGSSYVAFDSCSTYLDAATASFRYSVNLKNVRNRGSVKDTTGSFTIYILALGDDGKTYYPIAKASSDLGMKASQFTGGDIKLFLTGGVDSRTIGD